MSVALRVTGTWAELVADGTVAIPATPQAGDRMYLFARWKDFSVTATVANWTELVEFADGSTTSGNGTGSVKVACWYRDWQPGDTNPTIDFSAAPENASVVITVMQKDADDVWDTPVARTAAMTSWTTTSQSVSASASVDVPSSGVVMGLIGIRDDTATMTRPTNGIDDGAAAITWNGNYVESPATHHSTTTGDDGAADLGYRLVTTGATATLRMTGTISAAETGAALWVVQGVSVVVTPGVATLVASAFAPLLKLLITPAAIALTTTPFVPQLREVVTPAPASLSVIGLAPSLNTQVTPSAATLALQSFTPQLQETLTPETATASIATFAPTLQTGITPSALTFSLTTFEPLVTQNLLIEIPTANLTIITTAPHVKPFRIVWIDPGGDATHSVGHLNTLLPGVTGVSFDPTQQVEGAGSYKFDSLSDVSQIQAVRVPGVLGAARRVSANFRYDSIPDRVQTAEKFVSSFAAYSGGGFSLFGGLTGGDDSVYDTATPAQNSGQGMVFSSLQLFSGTGLTSDAQIISVKIIYERKYDVDTSEGISRVKWLVNGEEGPNHDNTDMPLTDTVVEVDVTNDMFWEPQHLTDLAFEVIIEARRGDTAVQHTQSWDYVKVEVQFRPPITIMRAQRINNIASSLTIIPRDEGVVLRFVDGDSVFYDGITPLLVDAVNRISFSYVLHGLDNLAIKIYVNGIQELSIENAGTGTVEELSDLADLHYGWVLNPGENKNCWFSHLAIDDGDDLSDIGNILSTAKLPATVNEDEWNTTGGTGAVNERPLSETNFRQETRASQFRQTYTIEAADEGDVDLTGKTLVGYMGWVRAKRGTGIFDGVGMVVNGVDYNYDVPPFIPVIISTTPALLYFPVTSINYPSDSAGIGMVSSADTADTFMFECGLIPAYEGPPNPDILLPRQEVANETLGTIVDDLRADPPESYEVCCNYDDFEGSVQIVIHSLDQDGGSVQKQPKLDSRGRVRIVPGVEVYLDVTVVGVTNLQIWRRINVD